MELVAGFVFYPSHDINIEELKNRLCPFQQTDEKDNLMLVEENYWVGFVGGDGLFIMRQV